MTPISSNDINLVYKLFSQIVSISSSDIEEIGKHLKKASYKKDEFLLKPGQTDKRICIVTEGIVHLYTYIDGDVFTINLSLAGMLFNSLDSYIYQRATSEFQQAVTNTEVLYLDKDNADFLMKNNSTFCYVYAKLFEFQLSERERRTLILQYKNAQKRFELFMSTIANAQRYIQEVPQKLIAQYLGLAPETFCRIKSQYLKQSVQ